jgi:hypothetical protein
MRVTGKIILFSLLSAFIKKNPYYLIVLLPAILHVVRSTVEAFAYVGQAFVLHFDISLFPVSSVIWSQLFPLRFLQICIRQDFPSRREKYVNVRGAIPVI